MIVGILNGYYRSGTTFMQRLYKVSNPQHYVLSEPTQHEIVDHIMANGCYSKNILHGWGIFEDYCKLPKKVLHEFIFNHIDVFDNDESQWGIMTSLHQVWKLLNPFVNADVPIVIKSTQLHLHLDQCSELFDCWVVHIDRATERIIADHFPRDVVSNRSKLEKILLSNEGNLPFYADIVFNNLRDYLGYGADKVENNLDKLVMNIEDTREIVKLQAKQNDRITIFDFDDFCSNPRKWIEKLPFKLDDNALRMIDPSKQNPVPQWLVELVAKSRDKMGG